MRHLLYDKTDILYICSTKKRLEYSYFSRESHKRNILRDHIFARRLASNYCGAHSPPVAPRHHHLFYPASTPNMSVTPMAYSTANWHWKNKTVTPWAKEWFERELVTIQIEGSDGAVVSVEHVISVDGDVELGRRKSKYVRAFSAASPPTRFRVVMCQANYPVQLRRRILHFRRGLNCTDNIADSHDLQVNHDL